MKTLKVYICRLKADATVYGVSCSGKIPVGTLGVAANVNNYQGPQYLRFYPTGQAGGFLTEVAGLLIEREIEATPPPDEPKYSGNYDRGFVCTTSETPMREWLKTITGQS